jgi:hypothetical protein
MRKITILLLSSLLFSITSKAQVFSSFKCNCDSIYKDIYDNAHYFIIAFHKNQIPHNVKRCLRKNLEGGLSMVNPSRNYNKTDVYNPFLKERRLLMYAQRDNRHIIVYEQGGMYLSIRVIVLIEDEKNNFLWCENILAGSNGSLFVKQLFDPKLYLKQK